MIFTETVLALLSLAALGGAVTAHPCDDGHCDEENIFPDFENYSHWAICKDQITKEHFPNLQAPEGGCVRYYRGIDITGVVTEKHYYFKDNFKSACDCVRECLKQKESCNNWVWKHTFAGEHIDDNKRSCTLYSSPNLPSGVTLKYDLDHSSGFEFIDRAKNNPQVGGPSPFTYWDEHMEKRDPFGVSGFTAVDPDDGLYC
jgi:hypothetical protein